MTNFKDYTPQFQQRLYRAIQQGLEAIGANTEATIVKGFRKFPKPPIDTGDLMGSVGYEVLAQEGETRVFAGRHKAREYAGYVEFGTYKMEARPYFRNGIQDARKTNNKLIEAILKKL